MLTILNLFGRSPFTPLRAHMEKVSECIFKIPELIKAVKEHDEVLAQQVAKEISKLEHNADLTKNDIRNHLPKSLYLPIDRGNLLEILSLQDSLADAAEDIAVVMTLKSLEMVPTFTADFDHFVDKNIEAFRGVCAIIEELHELLESSFGGVEAEKVRGMVSEVAHMEHQVDILQRKLLKKLIEAEDQMSYSTYDIWQKVFEAIASISNISEKLAYRVRMTLDIK